MTDKTGSPSAKSKIKWTEEQLDAITTRGRNLLVSAAAGAGKTAVLVERVVYLLTRAQNPVDIDELLVVTFTDAAASEMRDRIARALEEELIPTPDAQGLPSNWPWSAGLTSRRSILFVTGSSGSISTDWESTLLFE